MAIRMIPQRLARYTPPVPKLVFDIKRESSNVLSKDLKGYAPSQQDRKIAAGDGAAKISDCGTIADGIRRSMA